MKINFVSALIIILLGIPLSNFIIEHSFGHLSPNYWAIQGLVFLLTYLFCLTVLTYLFSLIHKWGR
jgi:hypothetical protein